MRTECQLSALEFMRRFLSHALPKRYRQSRSYGFLAGGKARIQKMKIIRRELGMEPSPAPDDADGANGRSEKCPDCGRDLEKEEFEKAEITLQGLVDMHWSWVPPPFPGAPPPPVDVPVPI